MRIGVISDTHGSAARTRQAVWMLESLDVEAVLHCGDIGSPDVVALLSGWRCYYVFGNCDHEREPLGEGIAVLGHTSFGEFGDFELGGARIALIHGHDESRLESTKASGDFDLVCTGHTHVAKIERVGETLVLNPGALFRADPMSIAVVDIEPAETGDGVAIDAVIVPL